MNHKHKRSKKKRQVIRVWTYPQAQRALPYITSVMRSLREHYLEAKSQEARENRLTRRPGRPDRQVLLDQEESAREGHRARERFNEAFQELQNIEVYCLDPNQGVSVLPFVHDDKLAWLIYDLFDGGAFQHWRYHDDPLEKRRPIREVTGGPAEQALTA
jgi:hypothetical protein